jgi:programmed cell death protein 5
LGSDAELEDLRKRRMQELRRQVDMEQAQAEQQDTVENQKQAALRQILTPEARQRLTRIKLVKPEFASQLELQLIQTAQTGKVKLPITDEQLRLLLSKLQPEKREIRVRRI